jgi:hypothetical protein
MPQAGFAGKLCGRIRAISHHPAEHVELVDADAGAWVLPRSIENFTRLEI